MLSRKAKVAPKAQKKTPGGRSRYLLDGNTAPKAGVSSVNKDTGIIPRKEVAKVEVHYDDPAVVDALALQDLSEEELEQRKLQLEQLKLDVIQDHSLPLRDMLQDEGCNWVFHRGAINANLMIIGEAPGEKEAELGRPFVGPSGVLLDSMLGQQGFNSHRHTFISNLVYVRPSTRDRDPTWDEINAYLPYVRRMIGIVRPKLVLCMGRLSSALFSKGIALDSYCFKYNHNS